MTVDGVLLSKQEARTVAVDTKPQVCHTNVVYTRRQKRLLPEAANLRLSLRAGGQMASIDSTCLGHCIRVWRAITTRSSSAS